MSEHNEHSEFHPGSKWQEPMGHDPSGLTLYDLHRKPRTVKIDPNHRSRLPLKVRVRGMRRLDLFFLHLHS